MTIFNVSFATFLSHLKVKQEVFSSGALLALEMVRFRVKLSALITKRKVARMYPETVI